MAFFLTGGFFWIFFSPCTVFNMVSSATLRLHCVGGCWDRAQDCCDFGIGQSDALTTNHVDEI